MFAARDQENLIHLQQTIAASKPLNQGTKALQAKTAGNRALQTPLKIPLNDENASRTLKFGKTGGKGGSKENAQAVKEGKKAVQLTSHDLATPGTRCNMSGICCTLTHFNSTKASCCPGTEDYQCEDQVPDTCTSAGGQRVGKDAEAELDSSQAYSQAAAHSRDTAEDTCGYQRRRARRRICAAARQR